MQINNVFKSKNQKLTKSDVSKFKCKQNQTIKKVKVKQTRMIQM